MPFKRCLWNPSRGFGFAPSSVPLLLWTNSDCRNGRDSCRRRFHLTYWAQHACRLILSACSWTRRPFPAGADLRGLASSPSQALSHQVLPRGPQSLFPTAGQDSRRQPLPQWVCVIVWKAFLISSDVNLVLFGQMTSIGLIRISPSRLLWG